MTRPRAHHPPDGFLSTQRPETHTKLFHEELGLFPRGEMPALGGLVEVDEIAESARNRVALCVSGIGAKRTLATWSSGLLRLLRRGSRHEAVKPVSMSM
jgi:hypothetical protein